MNNRLEFIGQIHTPYQTLADCPHNISTDGPNCTIEVKPQYQNELQGLNEGDAILVLYWLGNASSDKAFQPVTDSSQSGTFALRTPFRPNPIGAAVINIDRLQENRLYVRGLDCLDKTKLLDIKPAIYREAKLT